jgi:hypothetical protein
MNKVELTLSLEQILESMRQLSDQEKRALASVVLSDPGMEAFVEELDDHLMSERALDDESSGPFSSDELNPA